MCGEGIGPRCFGALEGKIDRSACPEHVQTMLGAGSVGRDAHSFLQHYFAGQAQCFRKVRCRFCCRRGKARHRFRGRRSTFARSGRDSVVAGVALSQGRSSTDCRLRGGRSSFTRSGRRSTFARSGQVQIAWQAQRPIDTQVDAETDR